MHAAVPFSTSEAAAAVSTTADAAASTLPVPLTATDASTLDVAVSALSLQPGQTLASPDIVNHGRVPVLFLTC